MKRSVAFGFGGLCLLAGSRWLVATYFPSVLPSLREECLHQGAVALLTGVAAWWTGGPRVSARRLMQLAFYGLLLVAVPALLIVFAQGQVSDLSGLALLTLVPAVTALVAAQREQQQEGEDFRRLLLPALVATGGAFLLIPMDLPASLAGKLWLGGLALGAAVAAWAGVKVHTLLQGVPVLAAASVISASCAVVLGAASMLHPVESLGVMDVRRELLFCLFMDLPLALLTFWLLREMQPVQFSTRFLLVPALSITEGFVMVRPQLTAFMVAGMVLMVGGAGYLLVSREQQTTLGLKLR